MPNTQSGINDAELDQMIANLQNGRGNNNVAPAGQKVIQPPVNNQTVGGKIEDINPVTNAISQQPAPVNVNPDQPINLSAAGNNDTTQVEQNTQTSGELEDIKRQAITELRPLVDQLDLPAEDKFDALLLLIRTTDDSTLIPAAHEAATGRCGIEGGLKDEFQGVPHVRSVDEKDVAAAQHVEGGHERDECRADPGNALHPEDDYKGYAYGDGRTGISLRDLVSLVAQHRDGVALHQVADAERGAHREDAEQHGQPFHVQPSLQRVHGAACHLAVGRADTVFHGQQPFCIFGGDAEHARQPAPKDGSRPAQCDSRGHADDVARADGGGEGRGQRAELAYIPLGRAVRLDGQPDGGKQLTLWET